LNIVQKRKNKTSVLRSALYGRVSSSRQVKSGDLKRQLSALKSHSRKRGHVIHKSYSDVGSGLNDKRRGLLKLLSDASLGKFEVVVVNYNDRYLPHHETSIPVSPYNSQTCAECFRQTGKQERSRVKDIPYDEFSCNKCGRNSHNDPVVNRHSNSARVSAILLQNQVQAHHASIS